MGVADGGGRGVGDQVPDRAVDVRVDPLVAGRAGAVVRVKGHPPGQVQVDQDRAREAEGEGLPVHVGVSGVVVVAEEEQVIAQRQARDRRGHRRGPTAARR